MDTKTGKVKPINFAEAVAKGLVSFELIGAGEGVTSKVILKIKRETKDPLTVNIPVGTEFVPKRKEKR